ncbi:DUF262 domain-containing HNH endonuclease family protein [Pseudomonas sp. JQ170C]|uniref:DUF262 domain-containing protein n=1 Tax=unclassified Pseudomonas TaxID=196821 RepID=UPI00265B1EC3|nr:MULTISPECIES: DUF262 domain-containing HNH endonuclease family protein [unclassified Pseudomonas]WRO78241.1 DUF262 domain-containing HNH endonuclease family protein [Pseudomonas sp. 170C]
MKASTTIRNMMANNRIVVPAYQRAYAWETPTEGSNRTTQTDVFLLDLEAYRRSKSRSPYYFGHFLFEETQGEFRVIDGQQRLTTISLFLAALFNCLQGKRALTEEEQDCYKDLIKRDSQIRFKTVDYDNQVFVDYVINQSRKDAQTFKTTSAQRLITAFEYFKKALSDQSEAYLTDMLTIVSQASCSTHPVRDEAEAIQMFIFQNNRGKRPSNLEVVKAQFMYAIHLHGEDQQQKDSLIEEVKNRFETIYKSISAIEYRIKEDDVLQYTLRVHFNSLWESGALDKVEAMLAGPSPLEFVQAFTDSLAISFEHLSVFFGEDERNNFPIHSLVSLGGIAIALPFILKAYRFGLSLADKNRLCVAFESLIIRHRLIGTRAEITSRISHVYEQFSTEASSIEPILDRIERLKTASDWWWAYWNNDKLLAALDGEINHRTAKHLLWKYEVHLEGDGYRGYTPRRYSDIERPELEHIAPSTEPSTQPHGYGTYDETFKQEYLNCLGNYLLLSKPHNCAVGNIPFKQKLATYTHYFQQREITHFVSDGRVWGKDAIQARHEKIVAALITML